MDSLMANPGLYAYFIILMAIVTFFAVMHLILWRINRDTVAFLYFMIFGLLAIEFGCLALLRSPNRIWEAGHIGIVGRAVWVPLIFALVALTDIYLAENNHHVSLLARLTERVQRFLEGGTNENRTSSNH